MLTEDDCKSETSASSGFNQVVKGLCRDSEKPAMKEDLQLVGFDRVIGVLYSGCRARRRSFTRINSYLKMGSMTLEVAGARITKHCLMVVSSHDIDVYVPTQADIIALDWEIATF